ncbi:MAG: dihydroorotate dehydrogenase [Candidatus Anoxymicrobium japonicum]|uniref:Dihydroorotate dehydrogenase n=1 Tax=Candidatus Anoxymicrobium japonicum TaxID=2013648 RepID=A0A2N3G7W2_9ACTN|nr:MAG: dihydroorotate dehydrogenase [Candidatus Anoxymicrobium japonicum]
MTKINLAVDLAGIRLENPVLLASGTAGYGTELAPLIDLGKLGGIILKSVTVDARAGNPSPRIWETPCGMLNSIGLENVGIDALVENTLPALEELGMSVFASIAGDTARDYERLSSRLQGAGGVAGIEVNVSCPNVEKGGIQFGADEGATKSVVMAVRENCSLPVFVKLSAAVTDITRIAHCAADAGATGFSLINTIPGLAIDTASRRPRLGGVTGGLSGPAIKPVALKAVWECYRKMGMPVIGGGGIYDSDDVVEFLLAGATAVSVGSAMFSDPHRAIDIVEGLPGAVTRAGASSIKELIAGMRI